MRKKGLPLSLEREPQYGEVGKKAGYATPRAFIGTVISTEAARSESLMARAATGFSHNNAMKAATMSQAIIT